LFLTKLEQEIKRDQLLQTGDKVLVGVSGGTDSMALLHGLHQLAKTHDWIIYVVHVDHQLRGKESEEDAKYVANFCENQHIPYQIEKVDVTAKKTEEGGNKQEIARELRYQAFLRVAKKWNISKMALAHHADDQVETIVMRVLRGTGPSGLTGIPKTRSWQGMQIVRPLLAFYRSELEQYLDLMRIIPRQDESNQSTVYTRNRLRLELIPDMMRYNPQVKQAILQLGKLVEEEEEVWEKWTKDLLPIVSAKMSEHEYQIDIKSFLSHPVALQRRMVKLILNCLIDENLPYHSIEQVLQLMVHQSPSVWISLPGGIKGVRSYDKLRLTKGYINEMEQKEWQVPLQIPGTTYLQQGSIQAVLTTKQDAEIRESDHKAIFDADLLNLSQVYIRNRRKGDRIQAYGFPGHKRIKALFMEKKIPPIQRNDHPIVAIDDEILWIPAVRRSAIAPVTKETSHFLILYWLAGK
jgi:tRNA(Ile)-lysidine synthase